MTGLAFIGDPVIDTLERDERAGMAGGGEDTGGILDRDHGVERGMQHEQGDTTEPMSVRRGRADGHHSADVAERARRGERGGSGR